MINAFIMAYFLHNNVQNSLDNKGVYVSSKGFSLKTVLLICEISNMQLLM